MLCVKFSSTDNSDSLKSCNSSITKFSREKSPALALLFLLISARFHTFVKLYRFYLKAAKADAVLEKRAKNLAVLSLSAHEQLHYWPSTVAAALVILACLEFNQNASHKVIGVIIYCNIWILKASKIHASVL